jgi:regulatory protein
VVSATAFLLQIMAPFMATITAITNQKRNAERVNIFLDGRYAFSMTLTAAANLTVGQTLTEQQQTNLEREAELSKAVEKAVRFVSYRPRSETELRQHLRRKQLDDALIEEVIARLRRYNYLNDDEFAAYWVEQRESFKPRSPMALRQELRQKGVDSETIDRAVDDVDELDAARRAAEKRLNQLARLPYDQFRAKLGGYLQRRGFSYSVIREVIQESWDEREINE